MDLVLDQSYSSQYLISFIFNNPRDKIVLHSDELIYNVGGIGQKPIEGNFKVAKICETYLTCFSNFSLSSDKYTVYYLTLDK